MPRRNLEGFAHSAAADGEQRKHGSHSDHGRQCRQCKNAAVARVSCMSVCKICSRLEPPGLHVLAPVAIWTYVSACSSAGRNSTAIWTYVYACFSAGDHMDLRLCMFERRRRYGVTFLHAAALAVIWTYVSAYLSVAGEVDEANVAVARVSCILRCSAAVEAKLGDLCCSRVSRIFSAEIAIKHKKNRVSEDPQIRAPVETLARGLKIYAVDGLTRHAGALRLPRRI